MWNVTSKTVMPHICCFSIILRMQLFGCIDFSIDLCCYFFTRLTLFLGKHLMIDGKCKVSFNVQNIEWSHSPCPKELFVRRNVNQTNYHLRDMATDLTFSKPKREFLKRSFKFSGAMLSNQLLNKAKLAESISSLKKLIRSWLGLANLCILIVANYLWLSV